MTFTFKIIDYIVILLHLKIKLITSQFLRNYTRILNINVTDLFRKHKSKMSKLRELCDSLPVGKWDLFSYIYGYQGNETVLTFSN